MKITALIPTSKTFGAGWSSFPCEEMEVEVVRVLRSRCDRTRQRYHYLADVKAPRLHPEAPNWLAKEGLYQVNVLRHLNPKWKPPVFENGLNVASIATLLED